MTTSPVVFPPMLPRGDISLVLYDVTTLYFEAEKEDRLRKVGYSKERRVDPQDRGRAAGRPCPGSRWRSAASKATKPKPPDPADHPSLPTAPRSGRHGRGRRRRDALGDEPGRTRRRAPAVHRRFPDDQSPDRSGLPLPLARAGLLRWTDHRHPHPTGRAPLGEQRTAARRTVWDPRRIRGRGGRCGPTRANAPCATTPL